MPQLSLADARSVETPAATMRTYAAPSTHPPVPIAVWRTELPAGVAGPLHRIDVDHVVVVLAGALEAELEGERLRVRPGDAVTLPAGALRRLAGAAGEGAVTLTAALPGSHAQVGEEQPVAVPWAR